MDLRFTLLENNKAPSFLQVLTNNSYYQGISYSQGTYTSYGYVVNIGKDILLAYTRHKREYEGTDTDLLAFLTWALEREVTLEDEESALQEYISNKHISTVKNHFKKYREEKVFNYSLVHLLRNSPKNLFGIYIEFDESFWLNQYPYMYILHERGTIPSGDSGVYLCTSSSPDWVSGRFESNQLSSVLLIVHEGVLVSILSKALKVGSYWDVLPHVMYTLTNESIGTLGVYKLYHEYTGTHKNYMVWKYKPIRIEAKSYKELGDICTKDNPYFDRDKKDRVQKLLKSLTRKCILHRKHGGFWIDD